MTPESLPPTQKPKKPKKLGSPVEPGPERHTKHGYEGVPQKKQFVEGLRDKADPNDPSIANGPVITVTPKTTLENK